MKYRDRNEIVHIILETCLEPRTKTRIMYKGYLSYTQLLEYLDYLLGKKLIELNGNGTYHITSLGREALDLQNRLRSVIGDLPTKLHSKTTVKEMSE